MTDKCYIVNILKKCFRILLFLNLWIPVTVPANDYYLDTVVITVNTLDKNKEILSDEAIGQVKISRTVDDLLKNLAGIDIKRTSLGGNVGGAITLRGFDESRFQVMLDGRILNGSGVYGGDYIDWSSLSTEDIDQIEIIRGAESASYGNTLGGVINIITKKGTKNNKTNIDVFYGIENTLNLIGSNSGSFKDYLEYNLTIGHWQTDGNLRNNYVQRNNFSGRIKILLPENFNLGLGIRYIIHKSGFVVENKKGNTNYDADYPESDEKAGGGPSILWFGNPGPYGPVNTLKDWGDESYWKNIRGNYDLEINKSFSNLKLKWQAYYSNQNRNEYFYAIDDKNKLVLERYSIPEQNWGWILKGLRDIKTHIIEFGIEESLLGYGGQKIKYVEDTTYFRIQPFSSSDQKENTQRYSLFL